ncbi:hypothetical protein TorRG33x02_183100 [Trema orientale]|uniref:Uncharacterized protein n=1 Tax=Trema orientale TaxID=63057 RepID=A0A2P5EJV5_TREOI|nr:hypothetical protein TorRG33x02_183100 [Trema orientale]
MLAVKRVPLGPWQRGLLGRGQLLSPKPTVKKRLTSMFVGTLTLEGLLSAVVKAVAVAVSLNAGNCGKIGLGAGCPFLQEASLYSRIAVVVVLSNAAFIAVW